MEIPGEYRLLSPEHVDLDLPAAENGIAADNNKTPDGVSATPGPRTREENFVYPIVLPFHYAPRFTVEVLTPLVRAVPGEQVTVRLTNNSRDGVKDKMHVDDSLAFSDELPFPSVRQRSHADRLLHLVLEETADRWYVWSPRSASAAKRSESLQPGRLMQPLTAHAGLACCQGLKTVRP